MSREKQTEIEEMAIVIDQAEHDMWNGKGDFIHHSETIAKYLYNAGYRKQSEGEWIEASNKPYSLCGKKCSLCGARITYREFNKGNHKYCHKCGAKMKGGE